MIKIANWYHMFVKRITSTWMLINISQTFSTFSTKYDLFLQQTCCNIKMASVMFFLNFLLQLEQRRTKSMKIRHHEKEYKIWQTWKSRKKKNPVRLLYINIETIMCIRGPSEYLKPVLLNSVYIMSRWIFTYLFIASHFR